MKFKYKFDGEACIRWTNVSKFINPNNYMSTTKTYKNYKHICIVLSIT